MHLEQLIDGKSIGSSTHSGFPHTSISSQNENEKCPYIKIKTNISLKKSEYCEEADKSEINENFDCLNKLDECDKKIVNVCEDNNNNNNFCIENYKAGDFIKKENQNLININCNNHILSGGERENNSNNKNINNFSKNSKKEFYSSNENKQINFNNNIIDPNTGQSNYSNYKKTSCSIVCENTFSFHNKKNNSECEMQNKVNAENDLYFSDNNQGNNNHNFRFKEG